VLSLPKEAPLKNADFEDAEAGPSLTALIRAQGKLITLVINLLESGGAFSAKEFAGKLGLFAVVVGESAGRGRDSRLLGGRVAGSCRTNPAPSRLRS